MGTLLRRREGAFAMPVLLVTTTLISLVSVYVISQIIVTNGIAKAEKFKLAAQFAADSGLDLGLLELTKDSAWLGTAGMPGADLNDEITLQSTPTTRVTYEIEVNDINSTRKSIQSTGRTYSPATALTPKNTRIFEIEVEGITASSVSIVTGVGGLILENSSKITDGAVFVNGTIDMDGTSQIGTSSNPLIVSVANKVCPVPADSTYPRPCDPFENDDPISITSPNARIYGEVSANYQFDDSNMINVNDPANSAIVASSGVSDQALPGHDRNALKSATTGNETSGAAASCTSNGGSRVWGPNLKINGDVTVSRRCEVTIVGDVWITGSLLMRNSGKVIVDDSLGSVIPTVMIDGQDGLEMQQSSSFVQNSAGKNVQIVTYWSSDSCSPECPDVSGTALAASQNVTTIDVVNSGGADEAIFYARWSKVAIGNSVNVGALVGQVVELRNGATIAFSSSLPGFTPTTTWVKKGYLRVFQ